MEKRLEELNENDIYNLDTEKKLKKLFELLQKKEDLEKEIQKENEKKYYDDNSDSNDYNYNHTYHDNYNDNYDDYNKKYYHTINSSSSKNYRKSSNLTHNSNNNSNSSNKTNKKSEIKQKVKVIMCYSCKGKNKCPLCGNKMNSNFSLGNLFAHSNCYNEGTCCLCKKKGSGNQIQSICSSCRKGSISKGLTNSARCFFCRKLI